MCCEKTNLKEFRMCCMIEKMNTNYNRDVQKFKFKFRKKRLSYL